jgi:hypothetical protein
VGVPDKLQQEAEAQAILTAKGAMRSFFGAKAAGLTGDDQDTLVFTTAYLGPRLLRMKESSKRMHNALSVSASAGRAARLADLLDTMQPDSIRFLARGAYGVAVLARVKSSARGVADAPMVVLKLYRDMHFRGCVPEAPTVCREMVGSSSRTWHWAAAFQTDRERMAARFMFTAAEDAGGSTMCCTTPHLLHAYHSGVLDLVPSQSIWTLLQQHRVLHMPLDPPAKHMTLLAPVPSIAFSLQEYGGLPLRRVLREAVHRLPGPAIHITYRTALMQVLHGLLGMLAAGDLHHNDLHTDNVLGTPTHASHLFYLLLPTDPGHGTPLGRPRVPNNPQELQALMEANRGSVLLRVPTAGMLWRLADFGSATSSRFHPLDHGSMARVWFGGPLWFGKAENVLRGSVALEAYDVVRLLGSMNVGTASIASLRVRSRMRRFLTGVADRLVQLGRHRAPPGSRVLTVGDVGRMSEPPVASVTPAQLVRDITELSRACRNTGLLRAFFLHLGDSWGFNVTHDTALHMSLVQRDFQALYVL